LAGVVVCVGIGLAVTVWVAGTRGLLRDRAVLDRWAGEATASLRSAVEQLVVARVLAAESSLSAALGEQDEVESARVSRQVSVIDRELREHAVAGERAAALWGREMPTIQAALDVVRAELNESAAAAIDSNIAEPETVSLEVAGTREIDESVEPE
jgi:glutathione S-transferase